MLPNILIIEPRREIADALADVVTSANYGAVIRTHVERLADLDFTPAAIIVRIAFEGISEPAHAALERLMPNRPPVVAIAWEDGEVAEAERLKCDIVLRAPEGVSRLCDALTKLVHM
jgi:hypothetical protein